MQNLHPVDIAVVLIYLIGVTMLGVWVVRWIRSRGDFFMPRRFGKAMMITFAFGTGTASDQAVIVASQTFRSGLSGIWLQWVWLPATPFYWLIAPIMRRFRAITTADIYALRYNASVAVLFAVVGIAGLAVKVGLLLKGSSALIDAATAHEVPASWAMALITVLFVFYGAAGGLSAAIVTDFVQGIMTILFSFMLLPFVFHAVGGMEGIRETVHDPRMFSLMVPGEIGLFFVVMFSAQALVGIVAQPFILGVCSAGRTEMDGRVGFMVGNVVKRICTIAWSLTALAGVAWYIQRGVPADKIVPDHVYGDIARGFLPRILPGLMGVFLASLMASTMSACSSMMVSSAALFTENVYRPLCRGRSDRHYVWVGRMASVAVVAGGLVFAFWVPDVVEALKIWFSVAPPLAIAFWMGLFWRRMTPQGAWAVTLTGFGCWLLTTQRFFVDWVSRLPWAEHLQFVWHASGKPPEVYEPWRIALYMSAAVVAGVVVSLLSRPVSRERLDRFYALSRTPVTTGERIVEPCMLPAGVEPPARRMLIQRAGLEVPMPSSTSLWGFAAGWLAVFGLVGGFLAIVSL